jgi:hypothetical protein
MARIAVLLRGHFFKLNYNSRGSTPGFRIIDSRSNLSSIKSNIIIPLESFYEIDLYGVTYPSFFSTYLDTSLPFKKLVFIDKKYNLTQYDNILMGLDLIINSKIDYDFIVISRFDLKLKKSISDFNLNYAKVNLPWRETFDLWESQKRVGDCFHIVPGKYIESFKKAIQSSPDKFSFHQIFMDLSESIGSSNIHFMADGFYDSNSDKMTNPIYELIRGSNSLAINLISFIPLKVLSLLKYMYSFFRNYIKSIVSG